MSEQHTNTNETARQIKVDYQDTGAALIDLTVETAIPVDADKPYSAAEQVMDSVGENR